MPCAEHVNDERGVKIKSEVRNGAEKIYNYIRRLDSGDKLAALQEAVCIINRRTSYVRWCPQRLPPRSINP